MLYWHLSSRFSLKESYSRSAKKENVQHIITGGNLEWKSKRLTSIDDPDGAGDSL